MAAIDSRQIFVGLSTGSILVWTLESGSRRATFNRQSQVGHTTGTTSTLASAAVGATASISGVVTNENSSSSGYNAISSSRHRPTMQTKKVLAAHTDGVTALAICANFNFIVSASRDHTAVIWHLNQFTYIRQLKGHSAAVSAVCANETTVSSKKRFLQ
jgi:WD40 repeat protein